MAAKTDYRDLVQGEMDEEMNMITDILTDIDSRKQRMSHFVSGLQVAVRSILAAAHTVRRRNPRDSVKAVQEGEGEAAATPPGPTEEEKIPKVTEEQKENTMTEDQDAEDSSSSNELMDTLNSTFGELDQAEEKLTEMNRQYHMARAGQASADSSFHTDFMHQFLADFRQKLLHSCEEYMSLESQTRALLDERRASQDMSYTLTNSPRKTVKPKDVSVKAGASEKSPTLPRKDEGKGISPATTKPLKQTDGKKNSPNITQSPTDAFLSPSSVTSDKMQPHELALRTRSILKNPLKQTDGKNISPNITQSPSDAFLSPSSVTSDKMQPNELMMNMITDDEEFITKVRECIGYDYHPMKLMFGTLTEPPQIFLPSPSPNAKALSPSPGLSRLNLNDSPTTFVSES